MKGDKWSLAAMLGKSLFAFSLLSLALPALAANAGNSSIASATASHTPTAAVPPALRSALYQTLARDARLSYTVDEGGCMVLAKQALTACFDEAGAHFTHAGAELSLHLSTYGRSENLVAPGLTQPIVEGNRVSYVHGALTAWWQALPMGFEQGFTLAKRPQGQGGLVFNLSSNKSFASTDERDTFAYGKLHYGQLVVTDADGKVIPAKISGGGGQITIAVNDAHAAYPLTVDPLVWIEQKQVADDGQAGDQFGFSVAVSGSTALIGVLSYNRSQGAAYVFDASNGTWTQTAKLTANDGVSNDQFGYSVGLSADGTTALIGAYCADYTPDSGCGPGAAYIFDKTGDGWMQTAKLAPGDGGTNDQFGYAVALAGSGTTAFVGGYRHKSVQGAVYVFDKTGDGWMQMSELIANDASSHAQFGNALASSDDGNDVLIGAYCDGYDPFTGCGPGAAYLFEKTGDGWMQMAKLTATRGNPFDGFGWSVALGDSVALIGAQCADFTPDSGCGNGAVFVFEKTGDGWMQMDKLSASNGAPREYFGWSLALDGMTALIAAPCAGSTGDSPCGAGAAYVFNEANGTWSQAQEIKASDGALNDWFGNSVAFDGTTALIGAYNALVRLKPSQGAVYFFGENNLDLNVSTPESVRPGQQYVSQTIVTNAADVPTPVAVVATIAIPAAASFISATPSQGACTDASDSGIVTCGFGQIDGNAGTATANVTFKLADDAEVGSTIRNTANVAKATPALTASSVSEVVQPDQPPVAKDGTLQADENKSVSGLLEASDPDGGKLTFSVVDQPQHGDVALDDAATGAYTYTPDDDYVGSDSFTFKANDGSVDSNVATVSITVNAVNHPPVAQDGSLITDENTSASGALQASDPDGDPLTFSIVAQPQHGGVTLDDAATGAYTYTPNDGYSGGDSFTFKASDGQTDSNTAMVSVTVNAVAPPPPPPSGGSGGGSFGWLACAALLGLVLCAVADRYRARTSKRRL